MKDERLLEELRTRLDIVDLISDYIEIKRAGQNYKGLCPFHSEKTPSFMVSPDKQIFHCFGCGVGGNIVNFVMKYENLSFHESLKLLAKKAGINLKAYKLSSDFEGLREKLIEIHKAASKVFVENLRRSKVAYTYLKDRGLTEETISIFSLGYALKDWHYLSNYLKDKRFSHSLILQSGLVSSGDKGIYDTFRDRIIFPICDIQGDAIAFGGRVMDDSQPKYLNSPDSPLFKKGETLYGLSLAKDGIRKKGYAIIVEGYFDAVMCHQYGFDNAVAPLGTALTTGHLQKLKRFTKKAVLVFDGDEAGKSAAKRSIPILFEQGFTAKILMLPKDDDPDSFLRRKGGTHFAGLVEKAKSAIDFIMSVLGKDKAETVHEALGIISGARDLIMKEELIRELSEKSGIRETVIREEMQRLGRKLKEKRGGKPSFAAPSTRAFCYDEELLLLSAVIAFPDRIDYILQMVPIKEFRNAAVKSIFEKLGAGGRESGIGVLLPSLGDEEKTMVTRLTFHPGFDYETVDKNIEDCIRRIGMRKSRERWEQIHEKIKQAEITGEYELLDSLLHERQRLIKEAR